MNKDLLNLQCLVGNYLNGFKILLVEKDPFVKDQINLVTDAVDNTYFGDKEIIKFYVRIKDNAEASIYKEQVTDDKYILNEFENWLYEKTDYYKNDYQGYRRDYTWNICNEIYDKLQELKGENKNVKN